MLPRGKADLSSSASDQPSASAQGAQQWLAKAQEDLSVARLVSESSLTVRWAACFHAQQAAEKAIKGLLVARGIDFPKSHALDVLAKLLDEPDRIRLDASILLELSPWAVAGRYPEDLPEPTPDETRQLIDAASLIADSVAALIGPTS